MTEEIPPERRCPICGDLSVYPHRDSLCPGHYPGDAPEPAPLDKSHATRRTPAIEAARAVAGISGGRAARAADVDVRSVDPSQQGDRSQPPDWRLVDWLAQQHSDDTPETDFMAAAMGDPEAAQEHQRDDVDAAQSPGAGGPSSAGHVSLPTGALPLAQLDALPPEERRRHARKRGLDWPTTEAARDQLEATIFEVMRKEDDRVVDAPTSLGKTHTVASTRWGARDDVTGGRSVVHLLQTRDARDEAVQIAEEDGGEFLVLEARHEVCPVAAGDYDPSSDDVDATDLDSEPLTIAGEPASEWLRGMCDGRGIPFSAVHRYLEQHNDQERELPCCADGECDAIDQWREYREGDAPLVIATHNFAFAPGFRLQNNIVLDEEPDFVQDLSTERVRRAVGAYLRAIDAPVSTWEAFVQLAEYEGYGDDAAMERDALEDALHAEPDREWYFECEDAIF